MQIWLRKRLLAAGLAVVGASALVGSGGGCDKLVINRFRSLDSAPRMPGSGGTGGTVGLDCISCHISEQGGRRATVLEFPTDTVRAHLSSSPPKSSDCQVCHDVSAHENGLVVLLDPDGHAPYEFAVAAELLTDPDLSDFCANCHDDDGATRLATPLNPFGGAPAPDVKTSFQGTLRWKERVGSWFRGSPRSEGTGRAVNSHHDISDEDQQWSGAKIECLSCHAGHASGATQVVSDPDEPHKPWRADITTHCLRCHAGGSPEDPGMPEGVVAPTVFVDVDGKPCTPGPDCDYEVSALRGIEACDYTDAPWDTRYTWSHTQHGPDSKRGWEGYSNAPSAELECTVCHDAHGSYTEDNPEGNPYAIRDFVDGTAYVDDGNWETGWLATGPAPPYGAPPGIGPSAGGGGGAPPVGGAGGGEPVVWTTRGTARAVVVEVTEEHLIDLDGNPASRVDWGGPQSLCSVCHTTWADTGQRGWGYGGSDGSGGDAISDWRYQHWHGVFDSCQFCHGHGKTADSHNFYVTNWEDFAGKCARRCHWPFPAQMEVNLEVGAFEDTACASCGDTKIERFEECDDGNQIDGDGCSNECKVE